MEFTVNPDGLDRLSDNITNLGGEARSQAGSIQNPSATMLGIFMAPFLSAAVPIVTNGLKGSVSGTGNGYEALGGRLKNTAKVYSDVERTHLQNISKITKDI